MFVRNQDIRRSKGSIPFWIIAERLGVHENTLLNWMKRELPEEKKREILQVISELKHEMESELQKAK